MEPSDLSEALGEDILAQVLEDELNYDEVPEAPPVEFPDIKKSEKYELAQLKATGRLGKIIVDALWKRESPQGSLTRGLLSCLAAVLLLVVCWVVVVAPWRQQFNNPIVISDPNRLEMLKEPNHAMHVVLAVPDFRLRTLKNHVKAHGKIKIKRPWKSMTPSDPKGSYPSRFTVYSASSCHPSQRGLLVRFPSRVNNSYFYSNVLNINFTLLPVNILNCLVSHKRMATVIDPTEFMLCSSPNEEIKKRKKNRKKESEKNKEQENKLAQSCSIADDYAASAAVALQSNYRYGRTHILNSILHKCGVVVGWIAKKSYPDDQRFHDRDLRLNQHIMLNAHEPFYNEFWVFFKWVVPPAVCVVLALTYVVLHLCKHVKMRIKLLEIPQSTMNQLQVLQRVLND